LGRGAGRRHGTSERRIKTSRQWRIGADGTDFKKPSGELILNQEYKLSNQIRVTEKQKNLLHFSLHFLLYLNAAMKYKMVIYDFDGTLADTLPYFISVFNRLAGRYRMPRIAPEQIDSLRGLEARQIIQRYKLPAWKIAVAGFDYRRMMKRDMHTISLFPGVDRLLQFVADQGAEQGMVSSNAKKIIQGVLGPYNASLIRYYECRASFSDKSKKIRKVLHKAGIEPQDAIYIGDEIRDIRAAHKVGMSFGAVTWGYTHAHALVAHKPMMVFNDVDDIIAQLGGEASTPKPDASIRESIPGNPISGDLDEVAG
jgi:phosphoglycolate phosphatase